MDAGVLLVPLIAFLCREFFLADEMDNATRRLLTSTAFKDEKEQRCMPLLFDIAEYSVKTSSVLISHRRVSLQVSSNSFTSFHFQFHSDLFLKFKV
jgi:hypothetical protein